MPESAATEKPEDLYSLATDATTRRRLEAAVVAEYRGRVVAAIRKTVPAQHWEEAEQVGCFGLLIALKKYDRDRLCIIGGDRGAAFWFFASRYVRDEIQKWMDHGVYWQPRSRNRRDKARGTTRAVESLVSDPLDDVPTVEELVGEAEAKARLSVFASTLNSEDREILFSENSQRVRSRRYLSLVERAIAFVRGKDAPVRQACETLRP